MSDFDIEIQFYKKKSARNYYGNTEQTSNTNSNNKLFLNYDKDNKNKKDTYVNLDWNNDGKINKKDIEDMSKSYFSDAKKDFGKQFSMDENGYYQIEVQKWGTKSPDKGKYKRNNDCLSAIIKNLYPDITSSKDKKRLQDEICRINNIENPDKISGKLTLPVPAFDLDGKLIGFFSPIETEEYKNAKTESTETKTTETKTTETKTTEAPPVNENNEENKSPNGNAQNLASSVGLSDNEKDGFYEVTVQSWGSKAPDGLGYANDCLSRIIANYYKGDIKLYSDDYNKLLQEICDINGIKNPDYIRTGAKITLPFLVKDENGKLTGFSSPEKNNGTPKANPEPTVTPKNNEPTVTPKDNEPTAPPAKKSKKETLMDTIKNNFKSYGIPENVKNALMDIIENISYDNFTGEFKNGSIECSHEQYDLICRKSGNNWEIKFTEKYSPISTSEDKTTTLEYNSSGVLTNETIEQNGNYKFKICSTHGRNYSTNGAYKDMNYFQNIFENGIISNVYDTFHSMSKSQLKIFSKYYEKLNYSPKDFLTAMTYKLDGESSKYQGLLEQIKNAIN